MSDESNLNSLDLNGGTDFIYRVDDHLTTLRIVKLEVKFKEKFPDKNIMVVCGGGELYKFEEKKESYLFYVVYTFEENNKYGTGRIFITSDERDIREKDIIEFEEVIKKENPGFNKLFVNNWKLLN